MAGCLKEDQMWFRRGRGRAMSRVAVVLVLLVALLGVGAASADSGSVIEGIDVSPQKIHFGTVTMGTCSTSQTSDCTVATVTITNTSSVQLLWHGEGLVFFDSGGDGINLGFGLPGTLGTCDELPGGILEPGLSCTVLVTAGWSGLPGHHKGELLLFGQFLGSTSTQDPIAKIPISVKLVS
jgi:hypothetical protein